MRIDHYVTFLNSSSGDVAPPWAVEMKEMLGLIIEKENQIMSAQTDALDQAEAAAAANSLADDSAEALLVTISAMVADLKNNQSDPGTTARITALSTAISDRAARLAAAVVANTPAANPPVEPPPVVTPPEEPPVVTPPVTPPEEQV